MDNVKPQIKSVPIYTKINSYEYINREDITEVIIPDGVTLIGERAFNNCKNLKKLILSDSLIDISSSAFSGCENLEEIVLPKNIKKLGYRAFGDCKRLKRIIIPDGIEELEWGVFAGCENLEEIVLPNSIKKIDKQIFLNCKKLTNVILPESITTLPDEFFRGCEKLDITLPKTITKLGSRVFSGCTHLTHFPINAASFESECFKDCRSLRQILLNPNTPYIPESAFMGCTNLESISYAGTNNLIIGESSFKNCKTLKKVPHFVRKYNKHAFEGCDSIKEITITDSHIPEGCFQNCKGLEKINETDIVIFSMDSFAFSGCDSLTNVELPNIRNIPAEAFSNCHNLKTIKINPFINRIGSRAFYRCYSLNNLDLPDNIETIDKEAFRYCSSMQTLHIPARLKQFGNAAFANMTSLEYIDSPMNQEFITPDHKILIMPKFQKLVLYAAGSKDKSYTLKDYNVVYEELNRELIRPISYIDSNAFTGAHNLEELTICGCTSDIEVDAFDDCPNLKKLTVEAISFGSFPLFNIRENGRYYFEENSKHKMKFPFDSIYFTGDISSIYPNGFKDFKDIKEIHFETDYQYSIGAGSFSNLSLVKDVVIPDNISGIEKGAFHPNTTLHFSNGLVIQNLISMTTDTNTYHKTYRLYTLPNMYYIEDDEKITSITKEYIDSVCEHSELVREDPLAFFDYMEHLKTFDLESESMLKDGILMKYLGVDGTISLFKYLENEKEFTLNILKHSGILESSEEYSIYLLGHMDELLSKIEILKKLNITNPLFYNKLLLAACNNKDFEALLTLDPDLLEDVLINSNLLHLTKDSSLDINGNLIQVLPCTTDNSFDMKPNQLIEGKVIGNKLLSFIRFIKDNNLTSKLLMNEQFISNDGTLAREYMLHFNNNLKRLVRFSGVFTNTIIKTNTQNFHDLLVLLKITGALEDDPIASQKAATFITEKIFEEKLPNGEKNPYRIYADDIHRIFNFKNTDIFYDPEFAEFFLENYKELYKSEIAHSGIIERIYKNFKEISRTSTSDHGSQRHLKVTLEKCTYYLAGNKFDGVTKENKDFATLIGWWYDNNRAWENAVRIYQESLSAPRNIFAPLIEDEEGSLIFDNDSKHDLREEAESDFTYQWLPKQDYDNLILGKYCNCCAHIDGAGQGIMRASMILDCCQNLVIRHKGKIVAKSTIYVNKEAGYAVFNNIECSLKFNSEEQHKEIYEAFMRGSRAFLETYNKNYPNLPLTKITVGINRNKIFADSKSDIHPVVETEQALYYGRYSLNGSGYAGDWSHGQQLVLKR